MTRLILIRHGQTDYNLQNRYCGFSDPCLNAKGIWQAERLADRLRDLEIGAVYSSDLKRACQTAKIIFKNPIEELEELREMNFGIFEGLKYEEILRGYPKIYRDWINDPIKIRIPEGEGLKDLSKRIRKRLSFIFSRHKDGKIALVTHSGPIRVMLSDVLKFNLDAFWQIEQDTGALNVIDYPKEPLLPTIVKMNDTSHLVIQVPIAL